MIKVDYLKVMNIDGAIFGMRMPMNSHSKSDSGFDPETGDYIIGDKDLDLMKRLYKAGPEHRKYLRQIVVAMDITSNQTFWLQFATYKVGTTGNSGSKMHTIHVREILPEDFSHEGISEVGGETEECFLNVIDTLNDLRRKFNETHEKKYWRALIDLLPMGYNLRAFITMNYENVVNIIHQRSGHKMFEWNEFCDILRSLPLVTDIMGDNG